MRALNWYYFSNCLSFWNIGTLWFSINFNYFINKTLLGILLNKIIFELSLNLKRIEIFTIWSLYLWNNSQYICILHNVLHQLSSVAQSCPTLCNPMNCSTPGLPVHHQLPEFTQIHVHLVGDVIQPSHPLSSPSPSAPNPSPHQSLFQWVNSSHEVAKILEFQLQHQSFQWTPRTDLL